MNLRQAVACLCSLIAFSAIYFASNDAYAQMLIEYPKKFRLTGIVELDYTDYFYEFPSSRRDVEYHSSFFQQTYRLGARGFIYHPRLAVFEGGITFRDSRQLASTGGKVNSNVFGYDLQITFLPYRPISLNVYANNIDYSTNPIGNFINSQWASENQDINYRYYGARLKIDRRPLPFTRIEYRHVEQGVLGLGREPGTIRSDEYTLDTRGNLRFWNTAYLGLLQYVDFSSPSISYQAKIAHLFVRSTIKKGFHVQGSFNYDDVGFSKLLSFSGNFNIDQSQLFKQYYSYTFLRTRQNFTGIRSLGIAGQDRKETINSMTGAWSYRFINGPFTSLSLNYGKRDETDEKANFYGITASVSYGKPFLGFNFSPSYRFIFRKDEIKGHLWENDLELNLVTRKIRWGTIYSNYSFILLNEKSNFRERTDEGGFEPTFQLVATKIDSMTHVFRTGIRGRGPGKRLSKAQWNIEGEFFHSDATIERPQTEVFFDEDMPEPPKTVKFERRITRYTLLGNTTYPVGWATIFFGTGFSLGDTNGQRIRKFFYEERVNYPVLRNFFLLVKWKQLWEKIANSPNRRIDEYDLAAEYRIGQTTLSLHAAVLRSATEDREIYVRRFFLRLRRTIF